MSSETHPPSLLSFGPSGTDVPQPVPTRVNASPPLIPITQSIAPGHPITTHSKSGIFKLCQVLDLHAITKSSFETNEPIIVTQAQKSSHWHKVMCEEYDALLHNSTWTPIPFHLIQNIIGCKWVFRIKQNPNEFVARYKARLVAKEFY